jgi:hypothetical protein
MASLGERCLLRSDTPRAIRLLALRAPVTSTAGRRNDARKGRRAYAGTSSNVVAARCGSAKPRTHFSDAFVSYFSA